MALVSHDVKMFVISETHVSGLMIFEGRQFRIEELHLQCSSCKAMRRWKWKCCKASRRFQLPVLRSDKVCQSSCITKKGNHYSTKVKINDTGSLCSRFLAPGTPRQFLISCQMHDTLQLNLAVSNYYSSLLISLTFFLSLHVKEEH